MCEKLFSFIDMRVNMEREMYRERDKLQNKYVYNLQIDNKLNLQLISSIYL